ncbi:hypothetical protein CNMCM5623_009562 [Aspergillus felis]|uniref:Uncharacterized protein n=1 Tax=Aspergillus felis TaxID=1287682 RepID=A0A8H6Q474_9EURO|nr:hypothetical protein CNMCM5623_009562 [Aspergillus felis]KAF7181410.1 hypothetical protein CNMCM7691_000628 [Aspergillus felis]
MNLKTVAILLGLCEILLAVPIQGSPKDRRQGFEGFDFGDLANIGSSGTTTGSNTSPFGSLLSGIIPSTSGSGSSTGTGNMIFPTGTLTSDSQTSNDETNQGLSGSGDLSQGGEGGQAADEGDSPEAETVV